MAVIQNTVEQGIYVQIFMGAKWDSCYSGVCVYFTVIMEWNWTECINFWFIMILIFWQIINTTGISTAEAEIKGQDITQIKRKIRLWWNNQGKSENLLISN